MARIVLERAVEMGSVQASFSLAETYDPLILAKWGTLGTRGDASERKTSTRKPTPRESRRRKRGLRRCVGSANLGEHGKCPRQPY